MKIKSILLILFVSSFITSCNLQKKLHDSLYFNDALDSSHKVLTSMEATIQVDDRLSIHVSALNPESAVPYNMSVAGGGAASSGIGNSTGAGYLVEKDGTINFPELGKIKVIGKTLRSLRDELTSLLTKYLTDPVVTVQFSNAKVIIMGEVGHPGAMPIIDGRLTILEAIIQAGDVLPIVGRKDSVLVIREENGERKFAYINLQSHNIYKSPYYFLKQNDFVYVLANKQKIRQQTLQVFISNIAIVTTFSSIITTLFLLITYIKK